MSTDPDGTCPLCPTDPESAFVADVWRFMQTLLRNYEMCQKAWIERYGVTVAQGYALLALPKNGETTMSTLSECLGLAQSTATRTVDQLVRKTLATRRPGEEDRREVLVSLTDLGREKRLALDSARQTVIRLMDPGSDEERAATIALLKHIGESLGTDPFCGDA